MPRKMELTASNWKSLPHPIKVDCLVHFRNNHKAIAPIKHLIQIVKGGDNEIKLPSVPDELIMRMASPN